jgi:NTP pyrophosphatase (non-canonical NTP hydrolase)
MKLSLRKTVHRSTKKWSREEHFICAIEECSELIKALTKTLRSKKALSATTQNIIDEIVDVQINIEAIIQLCDIRKDVKHHMQAKLQRLQKRITDPSRNAL